MEGWLEGERRRSCWNTGIIISVRLLGYYHNALPCPLLPSLEGMSQMTQKRNRNCVRISDLPSFLLLCVLSGTFFLFLIPFSHPPPPHDYFLLSGLTFKACSVLGPLHMLVFSWNLNSTLQGKHLFIDFLKTRFEQQGHKLESDGGRTQPWTSAPRRCPGTALRPSRWLWGALLAKEAACLHHSWALGCSCPDTECPGQRPSPLHSRLFHLGGL